MPLLKGYLLYEPEDAKKNTAFIEMFQKEAQLHNIALPLLLTTDKGLQNKADMAHTGTNAWKISMQDLEQPNFIINRSRIPSLSKALEQCGIHVFNSSKVCGICNDKQLTYAYLKEYEIPFMDFCWIEENQNAVAFSVYVEKAIQFGYPFVLKPVDGHGGSHVALIENREKLCEELLSIKKEYGHIPKLIFQRCATDIGKDLRVYVLGGKIVAGMMRTGTGLCSNFSLGGTATPHTLTKEETALTMKISTVLPADLIGIDFIYQNGHAVFNEIEDVVGTRMLYQYTNIDIVKDYMNYIVNIMSVS